eukprot:GHVT01047556.1.p1 GENE.GHVT01047556.1~~GHVT01047556.1.p1  ORF type:complete len:499 (-),score=48.13 GHVT01047556.1:1501-2997(-)
MMSLCVSSFRAATSTSLSCNPCRICWIRRTRKVAALLLWTFNLVWGTHSATAHIHLEPEYLNHFPGASQVSCSHPGGGTPGFVTLSGLLDIVASTWPSRRLTAWRESGEHESGTLGQKHATAEAFSLSLGTPSPTVEVLPCARTVPLVESTEPYRKPLALAIVVDDFREKHKQLSDKDCDISNLDETEGDMTGAEACNCNNSAHLASNDAKAQHSPPNLSSCRSAAESAVASHLKDDKVSPASMENGERRDSRTSVSESARVVASNKKNSRPSAAIDPALSAVPLPSLSASPAEIHSKAAYVHGSHRRSAAHGRGTSARSAANSNLKKDQSSYGYSTWGRAVISSLSLTFVTEFGDRTFFIAALLSFKYPRWIVLLATVSALFIMTFASTIAGQILHQIPTLSSAFRSFPIDDWLATILLFAFAAVQIYAGIKPPPPVSDPIGPARQPILSGNSEENAFRKENAFCQAEPNGEFKEAQEDVDRMEVRMCQRLNSLYAS